MEPTPEITALAERLRTSPAEAARQARRHRDALGSREEPVTGRAPIDEQPAKSVPFASGTADPPSRSATAALEDSPRRGKFWLGAAAALLAIIFLVGGAWAVWPRETELERSIVVLPFLDLSAESDNEHFSDGLTEEIITRLASVPGLKVISRTSAMHYKGSTAPLQRIAQELGVEHVLEGSVRQSDGRVRIAAQLIESRSDVHLWAQNYDYELQDIFRVQEEIAREVVRALEVELGERARRQLVRRGPGIRKLISCTVVADTSGALGPGRRTSRRSATTHEQSSAIQITRMPTPAWRTPISPPIKPTSRTCPGRRSIPGSSGRRSERWRWTTSPPMRIRRSRLRCGGRRTGRGPSASSGGPFSSTLVTLRRILVCLAVEWSGPAG